VSDWSKDIDLEVIEEYLKECAENDDYHYEQYQVDIVMHEYIRQKQIIERLNNIISELEKWVKEDNACFETQFYMGRCVNFQCILDKLQELKGSDKECK